MYNIFVIYSGNDAFYVLLCINTDSLMPARDNSNVNDNQLL